MGEDCSKREQDMYWTRFQSTMFFKALPRGFDQQLAIPEKFARNMKKKLPENVTVIGPSGDKWNIGLVSSGETLFFKDGWKKFVGGHFLKEDDVLIFKYNGESSFDVLVFNGQNFCERESSYFARKCGHTELDGRFQTKRNMRESPVNIRDDSSDSGGEKKPRTNENLKSTHLGQPRRKQSRSRVGVQKVNSDSGGDCTVSKKPRTIENLKSMHLGQRRRKQSSPRVNSDGSVGSYLLQYVSNRRPVTEDEITNALQRARAAWIPGSCIVVMRPSHVYRGFFLALPAEWVRSKLPAESDDVTLLVKEKKKVWHAKYKGGVRAARGLSGGWKDFAFDNNLEEFDVCLFKLASEIHDGIVMDVSIFRVVAEVSPLTRVTRSP